MIDVTYTTQVFPDNTITTASVNLPVYGRWARLTLTSYVIGGSTSVMYRFEPVTRDVAIRGETFDAQKNGMLRISHGNREIEQEIILPSFIGWLFAPSRINGGSVPEARAMTAALLRKIESLLETCRLHIRARIGAEVFDTMMVTLARYFDERTRKAVTAMLAEMNWRFMLRGSGMTDQGFGVIDFSLANNPIRFNGINAANPQVIDILDISETASIGSEMANLAGQLAKSLLRQVCGDELADEFETREQISFKAHGYSFIVAPSRWIKATDPNGVKAELCIHTIGLSCHPIDEVTISYLNIMHNIKSWLKTAIVHPYGSKFDKNLVILETLAA